MDCTSVPDSTDYNCTNYWASNCFNKLGFDFVTLWNITQRIQGYCPTDPRLFLDGNTPATAGNAALTNKACIEIAKQKWQYYPGGDIWVRLTTWKFPLLQLVASSPRPPLGFVVESFVILHLLGDPIGTIKDLLQGISSCQQHADFWRNHFTDDKYNELRLSHAEIDHAWKAFTIITTSFDEWGEGDKAQDTLENSLDSLLEIKDSTAELDDFFRLIYLTADALAADRATHFLPIIVAQGFFISAIGVAIAKITSTSPIPADLFINVEAHSIAFSALYFWILPAVFLTSIIGVSQTQNAIPRILRRLQAGLDFEARKKAGAKRVDLPIRGLENNQLRVISGGVYSWQPDILGKYESRRLLHLLQRNGLPIMLVVASTITAMLVSSNVPPNGWGPRNCAQAALLLAWLLSFVLTCLLKRYYYGGPYVYNAKGRFWITGVKDLLATAATMGGIIATQVGVFNRCDSYTLWGRVGLALPEMPDVAAVLVQRIGTLYPAIVFTSIGLQMLIVPAIVLYWYRQAVLVYLQRDDRNDGYWGHWRAGRNDQAMTPDFHERLDRQRSEDGGMEMSFLTQDVTN